MCVNESGVSEVTLKEQEVISVPSDQMPQCWGHHTWGYVRHCNKGTGITDLHLKKPTYSFPSVTLRQIEN